MLPPEISPGVFHLTMEQSLKLERLKREFCQLNKEEQEKYFGELLSQFFMKDNFIKHLMKNG